MKIAYLIAAHRNPGQVVRLVDRLDARNVSFFMHINKRTEEVFQTVFRALKGRSNVIWVPRCPVKWADFGLVRAFLSGMREICERNLEFDFIINPSGQDYPLKNNQAIAESLKQHVGKQLIEQVALPFQGWGRGKQPGGLERIESYYFWIGERCVRFPPARWSWLPLKKRRLPHGLKLYGGSAWWCLSSECVRYINRYVQSPIGRDLIRFFEHTIHSPEMFFHTVIMNSYLKDTVVNQDMWFIAWTRGSNPRTLGTEDYEALRSSDRLFARKFDIGIDSHILDLIDGDLVG